MNKMNKMNNKKKNEKKNNLKKIHIILFNIIIYYYNYALMLKNIKIKFMIIIVLFIMEM